MMEGKVVVVTGSGKGIGRHAAKTFAQEKARIVLADVDPLWLESAEMELSQLTETLPVRVDVRDGRKLYYLNKIRKCRCAHCLPKASGKKQPATP